MSWTWCHFFFLKPGVELANIYIWNQYKSDCKSNFISLAFIFIYSNNFINSFIQKLPGFIIYIDFSTTGSATWIKVAPYLFSRAWHWARKMYVLNGTIFFPELNLELARYIINVIIYFLDPGSGLPISLLLSPSNRSWIYLYFISLWIHFTSIHSIN